MEKKLDKAWKEEWNKYCMNIIQKNPSNFVSMKWDEMTDRLGFSLMKQERLGERDNAGQNAGQNFKKFQRAVNFANSAEIIELPAHKLDEFLNYGDAKKFSSPKGDGRAASSSSSNKKQFTVSKLQGGGGGTTQTKRKVEVPCPFCHNASKIPFHAYPSYCGYLTGKNGVKRMTNDDIVKIIKSKKLCYNCMSATHGSRSCTANEKVRCYIGSCTKRHCSYIHRYEQQHPGKLN